MDQKRKNSNFTKCEVDALIDAVESRKDILFGKLTGMLTADMKRLCWNEVTEKVNAVSGGVARMEKSVKKKWIDMCSLMKKKEAARRRDMNSTGGGECSSFPLSDTETKVVALLSSEAIEGVCGGVDVGIVDVKVDDNSVFMDTPAPGCSSNTLHDGGVLQTTEGTSTEDKERLKMAAGGKRRRENDGVEELTRLEKRRLEVEEERLAVEKRRLAVEEERLKLEQERWLWVRSLSAPVLFADE